MEQISEKNDLIQALHQLIQALRKPQSQEQERQVLSLLRQNYNLLAAFIIYRTHCRCQGQGGHHEDQFNDNAEDSAKDDPLLIAGLLSTKLHYHHIHFLQRIIII